MVVAQRYPVIVDSAKQQALRTKRRFAVGAEVVEAGVDFRVWAPSSHSVSVVLERGGEHRLAREKEGYFSSVIHAARDDSRYWFRLEGVDRLLPDPASRYQPEGPHGPSQVVDPRSYRWRDMSFPGVSAKGQILYELHVGTLTAEGSWDRARVELRRLVDLGVTVLQVMPIADFPGQFGWGYDGVSLFAPTRLYGKPDDVRRFVDDAHQLGLGVILDVVYNHFGPSGNYLEYFSPAYFTDRYENEWGRAINFDGDGSAPVREFFIENARYWVSEFHFDGLRLDATQQIFDASGEHILSEIRRAVTKAAGKRETIVVAENETQQARLARPRERRGFGLDILYNDDFHHAARVAVTGRAEAYYSGYQGSAQELASAVKHGFLFQGQWYEWQKQRRGTPALDLEPYCFLSFLQNHDQVANSALGERMHQLTSPARLRALTALLLLGPQTPLLFQGQEFAASAPFLYFAEHEPELAAQVRAGRCEFLQQFPSLENQRFAEAMADPSAAETFRRCKLDASEVERHAEVYRLHRDLLALRRNDAVFRSQKRVDAAALDQHSLCVRYFGEDGDDRLLVVNLGRELPALPVEPLLAPPDARQWALQWASEDLAYGGGGVPELDQRGLYMLSGESALVLRA